jgi:AraC-like DNA-binding protein
MPEPHIERAATPVAFVHAILLAYQRYGVSPAAALQRAQIAPSLLKRRDGRITASQMEAISDAAMRELDDEALGWFSRRLPWGSYGLLCRASTMAPTLGVALKRWCRHHRLLTQDILLSYAQTGDMVTISVTEQGALGEMREFCLLTTLRYLHGYACWAVDSRIPLVGVEFPFVAPRHAEVYPLMFPGPVAFGALSARLSFDKAYLSLPLRRDEAALRAMLQRALPLTVRQYRRDRLLVQRVRQLLRADAAGASNATRIAERLHVSQRTLHRQLHEEGASLQGLKDEARRDVALDLLSRTAMSLKQVAAQAGFRSEKSFSRAFKQWTGATPGEVRAGLPIEPKR